MKTEHCETEQQLAHLAELGAKSQGQLAIIDVHTPRDLIELGAVAAFVRMERKGIKPSLNFLYALVGAIENSHWLQAQSRYKQELLLELAAARNTPENNDR